MLLEIVFNVVVVVGILTGIALVGIVGLDRIRSFRAELVEQVRLVFPYLLLLGLVLLANDYLRDLGPEFSWIVGFRITENIISIEGSFVATLQSYSHPALTYYFSYIYIYGYIFLLVFPIVAYFLYTENRRPIRETALAYTLNYGLGVLLYIIFIAFGPRNVAEVQVDGLLYTHWPESQLLTRELNSNVNVFPSLHTSLAITIALLAYRWREVYRAWFPIALVLALSVAYSTMYLGIHWASDVVAGAVLAGVSVGGAIWLTSPGRREGLLGRVGLRVRRLVDRPVDFVLYRAQQWYERRSSRT